MILFAAALLLPWCAGAAAPEKGAVPVIFETDMGNDIDDALALDLLYKGMDAGHIRLIGVSLNKRSSTSFEFIDLMNTWYGYPDIPIAYTPRAVDNKDRDYTTPVCELKASDGKPLFKRSRKPGSWEDPVAMYRRISPSVRSAKRTAVVSGRVSSRSLRHTVTPVHTRCSRPERAESISKASASLWGFPSRRPSRNTMVSAARITASLSPARARAASAFFREMEDTISWGVREGS